MASMNEGRLIDRPWVRALAGVVAAVAVVASTSCGGGSQADETAADGNNVFLEDALGFSSEGMLARRARAENVIRDCMKVQGFEYVPIDPAAQRAQLLGGQGMSEEDFERRYGYGITTLYEQRQQQEQKLGPNESVRSALTEADRAAYDRALWGDNPDATFDDAMDKGDFTRLGGCTKQGADHAFGGADIVQTMQQKLDELDESILADARMVDAIKAWSKCMREAGYDLPDPEEVDVVLTQRLEQIVGPAEKSGDATYDKAALAALQQEEVAMVRADIRCEKLVVEPVEAKVRAEYEREFRKKNTAFLAKVPRPGFSTGTATS